MMRTIRRHISDGGIVAFVASVAGLAAIAFLIYTLFSWIGGTISNDPEARAFFASLTTWQWIAIFAVIVVWSKGSELADIAKALNKIADEMGKTRRGDKY